VLFNNLKGNTKLHKCGVSYLIRNPGLGLGMPKHLYGEIIASEWLILLGKFILA
jgi:hypothetical protein